MSSAARSNLAILLAVQAVAASIAAPPAAAQDATYPPGFTAASHTENAAPDYARLFTTDRVHELRIRIAPADFERMQADLATLAPQGPPPAPDPARAVAGEIAVIVPAAGESFGPGVAPRLTARDPMYVRVVVEYDGRTWPGVGMRYKGNSSLLSAQLRGSGKVPFRLDFDRYEDEVPAARNQRFYGFEKLTFSSNFSDDSLLREVLATEAFRAHGVPAARAAFYRIFVDTGLGDEYWGLYTMIEDPADGAMLDAQLGGRGGNLYKPSGAGASWSYLPFDRADFDKKSNEKAADFSDVAAALEALHAPAPGSAEWRRALEAVFDVETFLRWLAVNTAIANWDAYGRMAHNYYLYGDPAEGGRLRWIPWDHNMAFGMSGGGLPLPGGGSFPRSRVPSGAGGFRAGGIVGNDVLHEQISESWPLIARTLADETYAARYRELLEGTLDGYLSPDRFEPRASALHSMIAPYVEGVDGERATHTMLSAPGRFAGALAELVEQTRQRGNRIRAVLHGEQSRMATVSKQGND